MDIATLITASAGLIGVVGGLFFTRKGQRETNRQQEAANLIAADHSRLAETQQSLDAYKELTTRLASEAERSAKRAQDTEALLDQERAAHATTIERQRAHDAHNLKVINRLTEVLSVLHAVVLDEVAKAAAIDALTSVDDTIEGEEVP